MHCNCTQRTANRLLLLLLLIMMKAIVIHRCSPHFTLYQLIVFILTTFIFHRYFTSRVKLSKSLFLRIADSKRIAFTDFQTHFVVNLQSFFFNSLFSVPWSEFKHTFVCRVQWHRKAGALVWKGLCPGGRQGPELIELTQRLNC